MKEERVKTFLEEGYDFIEESCSAIPLEFTESKDDIIVESNEGTKSKYFTLGTCRGVFQPINEPSRNKRIYESNHWELQLSKPEVQERLKTRSMWGTLGHFDRRISDIDIREGLVSHIITKLEIREDQNMKPFLYGELEILDTPAGRILEAMYKGGANLYVSSRGAGKLLTVMGDDMKHVDPNSFWFEGFDIVRAPGFVKARPVYETADSVEPTPQPTIQEKQIKESAEEAQPRVTATTTAEPLKTPLATSYTISNSAPKVATNEEVEVLKEQIDKLAKVLEKVVDDVYEAEEVEEPKAEEQPEEPKAEEQPEDEEPKVEPTSESKAALIGTLALLSNSNISEGLFEQIVEIIKKSKEEKDK